MTNSLTTAVATARELKRVLEYTGLGFELEEGPAPGGCRLRLASSAAHPWACGDVRAHLLAEGITAEVARREDHSADPGGELVLTLSSEEEVRGLGRLLEARLTEVQNAALQLHRALAVIGVERHVDIQSIGSRALIDTGTFDPDAATLLYRGLGGDEPVLRGLDLTDWHDHERFVQEVEQAVAATGRAQLVESVPVCGECRERHGGNRLRFDYLDAEDALHLADALRRNAAPSGVSRVNTDTSSLSTAEADRLRNTLVDRLQADGHARKPATEAALRNVPRHVFVPDATLEDAYANAPVHIKYDTDGTSLSCASQPGVVALMLDQLDVQPGERILELGAGTGYNAGLLAHLVGEHGHVTTLDVDEDLVEGARAHLAAAGIGNVEAVTRDGALGYAEGAPYDRIIATVGAHGVPHAWLSQLAPEGRLLVPQRLKGTVARSIAYEQRDGRWVSLGSEMNTFMPLRRGIADDDRRVIPLSADGSVRLQAPAALDIDAGALAGVLDRPRTEEWTGMTVRAMESPEWMELFVTCSLPSGLVRMLFPRSAKGTLLTEDPYPSSTAAVEKGAVAYLARRLSEDKTSEGGKLWEFGVIGHGPGSGELVARVADAIRTWDHHYRDREATFEIQPLDAPDIEPRPGLFVLGTPLNRIVVDWR